MSQKNQIARRNILVFCLLLLIFIVPFVGAWFYYKYYQETDAVTVNRGNMITPPLAIMQLPLQTVEQVAVTEKNLYGRWLLLYISPGLCGRGCENSLVTMRQVQLAVGKHQTRVARVFVTYAQYLSDPLKKELATSYAGTHVYLTDKTALSTFLQPLPAALSAIPQGYLYIVDPYGNMIMGYAPEANGRDVLKDLERLLKVSQIG